MEKKHMNFRRFYNIDCTVGYIQCEKTREIICLNKG